VTNRARPFLYLLILLLLNAACTNISSTSTSEICPKYVNRDASIQTVLLDLIDNSRNAWGAEALVERLYEFDKYVYIAVSYPGSSDKIKMASYDFEFDSLDEVLGKSQFFFPSISKNVEIANPANFSYEGNGIRASLLDTPDTQFNYFFTIKNCLISRIEYQIEGGFDLKLSYKLDEETRDILARANEEL
jgi:hypothetical protein